MSRLEYRYTDEDKAFRERYTQKVNALIKARFPTLPELQQAIREKRIEKQYPMSLSGWVERVVIDGVLVAELTSDSYFVISKREVKNDNPAT